MSREIAKQIVLRSKDDPEFLEALLTDSETILAKYELSDLERKFFRDADRKTLEGLHAGCFELADKLPET